MGFQGIGKEGSILDLVFIMVFIFVAALSVIIAYFIYSRYTDATEDVEAFNNTYVGNITAYSTANLENFDYLFIFIVFGLLVLTVVSGFYVASHPVFFFISLMTLILVVILGAIFANIFDEVVVSDEVNETVDMETDFPIIDYFMSNYPTMILILGVILMVVFYAKSKLSGGP